MEKYLKIPKPLLPQHSLQFILNVFTNFHTNFHIYV